MPATARRSKSEAYEKGIREGTAMAARARNMEPEEEGEEEEMDMAMQPGHSRKRSAKGAKETKPATDGYGMKKPMDAECGCSGKKGGKCDGNCGSMRKRSDSLSPLEYLDACELGIQDRSTAYIRARLDTAEARNDLKCGKGAISEGEKCTKGSAHKVQPKQQGKGVKTALKVAAGLAAVGVGAYAAKKYGPKMLRNAKANALKTKRKMRQTTRETIRAQMKKEGATPEQWMKWRKSAPKAGATAAEREQFKKFFYKNTPGVKKDSIWAEGFEP